MREKIYFIDGHALIFKMYYAFMRRPMINSKGADMSILFGFTKYILELIAKESPEYLAVAFDPPGGTFRNKLYSEYKANRPETPQLIIDALEPLQELCKEMNIPTLMVPGFEADDVIGSMAKRCSGEGLDVYMVTPDKDYGQLVSDHVWQRKPGKSGADDEIYGVAEICAKYGISSPLQVIDLLAICGDNADNVPGVKGVGEIGAGKLLSKFGSVDGIYAHLDELSPKQKAMFEEARGHIGLSRELVTIKTDMEVPVSKEEMKVNQSYGPRLSDLFELYEFNSLKRYIGHVSSSGTTEAKEVELDIRKMQPEEFMEAAKGAGLCSIITEAPEEGIFKEISGMQLCSKSGDGFVWCEGTADIFKELLENEAIAKCGEDMKRQMNLLAANNVTLKGKLWDIGLMHYLLDPEKSHKAETLAPAMLGMTIGQPDQKGVTGSLFDDEPENLALRDRSKEAAILILLTEKLKEQLEGNPAGELYAKMEEPLIGVLSRMERNGVKVDLSALKDYAAGLRSEMVELEGAVREMAGMPDLNVSSPKQVGEVLFGKLQLDPKAKKNAKGAYTTDEETLTGLLDKHPIVNAILEYRGVKKLLSTYIEPFSGYINPADGRVHTTFNQALTATGRLSSSNPNLQNIPIRTDRGREIRKAFTASGPDRLILSADYSQIELRIMAHLSCDAHLVGAFRNGIDVHAATASKIFGVHHDEVTPEMRRIAKTANFGIMYGISAFGLAQRLRISRKEAQKIIDDYFASFPAVRSYIEDTKIAAREQGYVETIFGRRRYLPDINSKNASMRLLAERNAVNAPIQGTSADIIKMAMIGIDAELQSRRMRSQMVLQIHDELVFDAPADEIDSLKALVTDKMENVTRLSVPLTIECNYGKNWLEAH